MQLSQATLSRLKHQHLSLNGLLEGLGPEQVMAPGPENKWSIHQQLAHLASYQPVFKSRLQIILETFNASFDRYSADADPEFILAQSFGLSELQERLNRDRADLYLYLTGMNSSELVRKGRHPVYGNLNVSQWTEFFLLHEAHHLFAIFRLANILRKKQPV
jgi:uncharacterized damage-inducible protein DinB